MAIQQYQTKSAEETQEVGEKFARSLSGGEIVALYGELGTGKTTFVQGLARGLGIKDHIVSPSYVLVRQYSRLIHVDLYRLDSLYQVHNLGLEELFEDQNSVVVIEWADRMKDKLPKNCIKIKFESLNSLERRITIEYG